MATSGPTLSDNIAAEMKRHKISQATLAAHLGISQAAVSARFRTGAGGVEWRVSEVRAVAELLGVDISVLIVEAVA